MISSPALSAQSEDDLFPRTKRLTGYETIDTVPVHRIQDCPEPDTLATLPPLPQSQYTQTPNGTSGRAFNSQYVTQPTQIIPQSPATATEISSPPPSRSIVQVEASSPMAAPKFTGGRPGLLAQTMNSNRPRNLMAPAGTSFANPNRPPSQPAQPLPKPQNNPIQWDLDDLESSEDEIRGSNDIKKRTFVRKNSPQQLQPHVTGSSFSEILNQAIYRPDLSHPVKRSADQLAGAYGNVYKKPRQVGPSRAVPVQLPPQPVVQDLQLDDIMDPNMRKKIERMRRLHQCNTIREIHDAIVLRKGNTDDASDYLLLMSEKKAEPQRQQQARAHIIAGSSDDELAPTPARPKGVATSTQFQHQPVPQPVKKKTGPSIAQKYGSTQVPIAAAPRKLDIFDTPPPQELKKRTLMRGRKDRSPSPATRAEQRKKAIVLDDSGDEMESGVQSEWESGKFDARVLQFFNSCSTLELSDISGFPKDTTEHVVSQRPFKNLQGVLDVQHPNNKNNKNKRGHNSIGERVWDKVYEMMKSYEAVDSIVKDCEGMAKPLAHSMSKWGVDVYGKGTEKSAGLDFTSLELMAGNSHTSSGKDSGIGTPISDDGKQGAKKGFIPQPVSLAEGVKMKDYQIVGLNWLHLLYKSGLSGILADDMGLGKTLQTIAFIAHLAQMGETGPHLIVVPSATLENWLQEFNRFAPFLNVKPYYGSIPDREWMRMDYENNRCDLNVLVTTYQIAKAKDDNPWLRKYGFTCAIFDEGHMLKNPTSDVATKLTRIRTKFRLLLTGTPLQNNLNELMGLLKFLMPDIFNKYADDLAAIFKQQISATTGDASNREMLLSKQRIDRAKSMLTPFILRRKKYQVLKDLAAKTRHVITCDMSPEQNLLYQQQLAKAWDIRERKSRGERVPPDETSNVLIRLRQAAIHPLLFRYFYDDKTLKRIAKTCPKVEQFRESNPNLIMTEITQYADFETHELCAKHSLLHPYLLAPEKWERSGKVLQMLELLNKFKSAGHKTLIFSQFVMVLDILGIILRNHSIPHLRLDGSTKVDERQTLIDEFNNPEKGYEVFMLSTKAGGAGINLTGASRVIVFDSGFNPQDDVQAENRCHRIGQNKDVEIYRLVSKDSVEEQIYEMGKVKLQLDREVAGEDGADAAVAVVMADAENDNEAAFDTAKGKRRKDKDKDANGGLSKTELDGASMVEDLMWKKLKEQGKTPSAVKTLPFNTGAITNGNGYRHADGTSTPASTSADSRPSSIASIDIDSDIETKVEAEAASSHSSPSSNEDEDDDKPLTIRGKRLKTQSHSQSQRSASVIPQVDGVSGRSRRKAAIKASSNLKDPLNEPLVLDVEGETSQRSTRSRGETGSPKQEASKKKGVVEKGQATLSRSGRLIRGSRR